MITKSRIQAVISQNRRDEIRKWLGLRILLILMVLFVIEEVRELSKPNIIFIENTHAEMVTAAAEVSRYESTAIEVEHAVEIKTESTQQLIEKMIMDEFGSDGKIMIAIAKAESGQDLNPMAHNSNRNGSIDTGVFQINSIHGYDQKWLQDPKNNIKAARKIKDTQGLSAWVAFSNGNYRYNL